MCEIPPHSKRTSGLPHIGRRITSADALPTHLRRDFNTSTDLQNTPRQKHSFRLGNFVNPPAVSRYFMNDAQNKTAEEIIFFLQSKNNIENISTVWQNFNEVSQRDRYVIVNSLTDDYNLIKPDGAVYFLTKKGKSFTSFEDLFSEEKLNEEKANLEFEKSKIELKLNKWLLKTKWIPHLISLVSFIFAVYVFLNSKNDTEKMQSRITELEKIVKVKD